LPHHNPQREAHPAAAAAVRYCCRLTAAAHHLPPLLLLLLVVSCGVPSWWVGAALPAQVPPAGPAGRRQAWTPTQYGKYLFRCAASLATSAAAVRVWHQTSLPQGPSQTVTHHPTDCALSSSKDCVSTPSPPRPPSHTHTHTWKLHGW
jgi:hypothetical protein